MGASVGVVATGGVSSGGFEKMRMGGVGKMTPWPGEGGMVEGVGAVV